MIGKHFRHQVCTVFAFICTFLIASVPAFAQNGAQGKVLVTVVDSSGAVVPGASLVLVQKDTNSTRTATTESNGTYSFVGIGIGTYSLKVTKPGYSVQQLQSVVVQATLTTPVKAVLAVGQVSQVVDVSGSATPVLQTSSNEISTVIDVKQIEDLPLQGRDLTQFASTVAGYNGTFNGLPSTDQGSNIDGMVGSSNRMKFVGNTEPSVTPRIESIEQVAVQTDQLDLNAGYGQSSTQLTFVSKSGSNNFHGRIFEDFQNGDLNANTYGNNAFGERKNSIILNDFGGSVGGPILHNKLFFFGTYAMSIQPGTSSTSDTYLTTAAQAGTYLYGENQSVNVLALGCTYAPTPGCTGGTADINPVVQTQLTLINGALADGESSTNTDPNYNTINWQYANPTKNWYPVARLDYNVSSRLKMYLSALETKTSSPTNAAGAFPGSGFSNQTAGYSSTNYTLSYGMDFMVTPNLVNQLKLGYLYEYSQNPSVAAPLYGTEPTIDWGIANAGQNYQTPVSTFYPVYSVSDAVTWLHGGHSVSFGGSWYKEQDHYWNPPIGYPNYYIGLAQGDPSLNAFNTTTMPGAQQADINEAESLYATLVGRISGIAGTFPRDQTSNQFLHAIGAYNLDEVVSNTGLFAEDSWKVTPSLTVNYGMRWDFQIPQHDLTGAYHSATPAAIYGPSGLGNLFHPGVLTGEMNPEFTTNPRPYGDYFVTPQPAVGFVWNPKTASGALHSLLGSGTVLRGGYALRRFTEPGQYFWNQATAQGSFYFQDFYLNANSTGQVGTFQPGSLSLQPGGTNPWNYAAVCTAGLQGQPATCPTGEGAEPIMGFLPATYQLSEAESDFTFTNTVPLWGLNPNIRQPYSQSWNIGIQRSLGRSRVLEVRYNGNRTIHQWITIDPNEVNVFENGFLTEFKQAQANLAAYNLANPGSANPSFEGSVGSLPIMEAAFGAGDPGGNFTNSSFVQDLQNGAVGSLASTLSGINGNEPFFCNLVGASFAPCANNAGYTGAGAGYPINFFQANPFAAGATTLPAEMVDSGFSNYNGLQIDFRQSSWKGLQFDVNYTWSHSLGIASPNEWTGGTSTFTLRNFRQSYGPSLFDITQVTHANGTYELPFGHGKPFLSHNGIANAVVGGWTLGTIATFQTGTPGMMTGGNATFNDYADGGVVLTGVTAKQLQKSVGVHRVPGTTYAYGFAPQYINTTTHQANTMYLNPNTTPGTISSNLYIRGPHAYSQDLSVSKTIPIYKQFRFRLQGEFLNVWNHPTWGSPNLSVVSHSFGREGISNQGAFGRSIELRANIEF